MLENLFWMAASAVLFIMLMITVTYGCIEYSRQAERDNLRNPGKPDAAEDEPIFPELSRWELNRALCNARKTDKLLHTHRRHCYAGYRR